MDGASFISAGTQISSSGGEITRDLAQSEKSTADAKAAITATSYFQQVK